MRRALFLLLAASVGATASADVTVNLITSLNGDKPIGGPNYLTALFQDVSPGNVRLTVSNNMRNDHFVPNLLFNVETATPLTFVYVGGQIAQAVEQSSNAFNGGSSVKGGNFDIQFTYATSNSGGQRFSGGETSTYNISGTGLKAANFLSLSVNGGYAAAARVQGIGNGSGSVGAPGQPVPEPATLAALGLGGLALLRRRRK